ncbi:hypothetical protein IAR55_006728 [Kwoniella newhampshirensis]|uniref:Autophagy-related protein 14 n=1 Tax=Kwoniella newhampshirensis TaxID=1651941 RepID=A0AAW0YT65_9TREE
MTTTPQCPCCQLSQNPLYCPACLQEGINLHKELLRNLQIHIDSLIQQSRQLLEGPPARSVNAWRELRAEVANRGRRCANLKRDIAVRESGISTARQGTQAKDKDHKSRRATLQSLRTAPSVALRLEHALKRIRFQQQDATSRIVHARQVLVREALSVFGLHQNSRRDWEIAGIVLPSPEVFRLHPSASINGAISHTVHLLSLITSYLSITLPFIPTPPPPASLRHVGRTLIKANTPFLGTTKWRDKHVLWMSSTASIPSKSRMTNKTTMLSSTITKSISKHRQFLTSFALLSFSVAYLAWSQGVPGIGIRGEDDGEESDEEERSSRPESRTSAPTSQSTVLVSATCILQLIHALSVSPTLGQKAHEPGGITMLPHLGFGLDVAKVVQTVLSAEENRWGTRLAEGPGDQSEGWDLLDVEG